MEPQVQASFIPKKPLSTETPVVSHYGGILWFVASVIFVLSLLGAVGVFAYQAYLQGALASADQSLTRAQAAYDPAVIADLVRLDTRMVQSSTLLQNHLSPSAIFTFLENNTLSSVRFTDFDYSVGQNGAVSLALAGEALDFSSVALQSDAFGQSKALKDVLFSDVNIDPATGHVVFKVNALVDPSLVLYRNTLTATPAPGGAAATTTGQ